MTIIKVYKDRKKALTISKMLSNRGYKPDIIKLAYPKGQYLLYASGETMI